MRWQSIATDWKYYVLKAKRHWVALSDQQLASINGSYDRLVECLQESYGLSVDAVKDDIREWCATFGEEESSLASGARNERQPRRPPHSQASR
jgi:uncharacterized protein YjbJ (UPF0337 family)